MFDNLIESKAKPQRSAGGTIFSIVFHTVIIAAAVYGTLEAKQQLEKPKAEKVEFVKMEKKNEPPPKEEPKPPPRVELRDNKIEIHEKIQFEVNKATILEASYGLLDEIAN